jgi:glucan-binding YG repeat protein
MSEAMRTGTEGQKLNWILLKMSEAMRTGTEGQKLNRILLKMSEAMRTGTEEQKLSWLFLKMSEAMRKDEFKFSKGGLKAVKSNLREKTKIFFSVPGPVATFAMAAL